MRLPKEGATASIRLFRAALEVGDLDEAKRFYRALFGTPPRSVGGGRLYVYCGEAIVALVTAGGEPRSAPQDLYFEVEDVDAVYARANRLGALSQTGVHGRAAGEVLTRPWGERSFYAVDPWGNGLCFVQSGTIFTGE
jgi:catechol 2,3-dioxygenase-like lactoylglutathione lyase family enzyme